MDTKNTLLYNNRLGVYAPGSNILMCEFLDMLCATNDVDGRMLLVCGIIINFNIEMNTIECIYYLEAMSSLINFEETKLEGKMNERNNLSMMYVLYKFLHSQKVIAILP